jgi:hypothetical protein
MTFVGLCGRRFFRWRRPGFGIRRCGDGGWFNLYPSLGRERFVVFVCGRCSR